MSTATEPTVLDKRLVSAILERVCEDISTVVDRPFQVRQIAVQRATTRAAGAAQVHVSFRLEVNQNGSPRFGALLLPLPEAISLACYLMMVPDDGVAQHRKQKDLDRSMKDAMLEIGNFIGGAAEAALRGLLADTQVKVRSKGCQGVRADVRPAFPYTEGDPLLVARAKAQVAEFKEFDLLLLLPPIDAPAEA